jgi:hypothetical protein
MLRLRYPAFRVNVKPQSNILPIPLNNAHVGPFSLSILSAFIVAHDQSPQPIPILSTCLQLLPKTFYPTHGRQFTLWGLTHHQHSYHASNPSNLNLHDHPSPIPSFILNSHALVWVWVLALDVLGSFNLGFCRLQSDPYSFIMWWTNGILFFIW